jgi:uncharacterized metal-binding protein YceD (DUF177 family)
MEIGSKGWTGELHWDPIARRRLTDFLDLVELTELVADVNVLKSSRDANVFILKGSFKASFVQECVVCLGPISGSLKEAVGAKFVPTGLQINREDIFTPLDEDHPEIYMDGMLEVGKLVEDQLSLSLAPYPKHEQDQCGRVVVGGTYSEVSSKSSPFSDLPKLLNEKRKNTIE